tara:strand:- start:1452 stop:2357 length:906 start_codon:yes stop_codon:yes gene_type:complete
MHCFNCNSNNNFYLFDSEDYVSTEKFKIFRCKDCNLDYPEPRPKNIDKYYQIDYRKYNNIIQSVFEFIYYLEAKKIDKLFKKNTKKNILEIGCGSGILLKKFKSLGWNIYGTERQEYVNNLINNELNITSKNLSEFEDNFFDLIILNNSFEHLMDPSSLIPLFKIKLKTHGCLVINIPSSNSYQYIFGKGDWFHLDVPRHLQIFADNYFYNFSDKMNFSIKRKKTIGFFWEFFGWFQTLNNKLFMNRNNFFRSLSNFKSYKNYFFLGFFQFILLALPSLLLTLLAFINNKGSIKQFIMIKN